MKLRKWQATCITKAYKHYLSGRSHFLCLATPGAGKTVMASELANRLLQQDRVDLVICISPSVIVASDFKDQLEQQINGRFDGSLGSIGSSITYQSMCTLGDSFWALLDEFRVFVIFDEIHHCAGNQDHNTNAWGEKIIDKIQGRASYTLALTGTPWRSDNIPISLSSYCDNNRIHCDYVYGLFNAISDHVCRTPRITLIDNDQISFDKAEDVRYGSIAELLDQTNCRYQDLIEHEALITYLLTQANTKLTFLRRTVPNAAGLIVATSVEHARQIHQILNDKLKENADIATYLEEDAFSIIQNFKHSNTRWIIAVGMISEGTNIPRLQVCCHLTRVKTEMHFRQVLGRILRVTESFRAEGFLYLPAEPTLLQYAHRVAEDIPSSNVVLIEKMSSVKQPKIPLAIDTKKPRVSEKLGFSTWDDKLTITTDDDHSSLARRYDTSLGLLGRFKQEVLSLNGAFMEQRHEP